MSHCTNRIHANSYSVVNDGTKKITHYVNFNMRNEETMQMKYLRMFF